MTNRINWTSRVGGLLLLVSLIIGAGCAGPTPPRTPAAGVAAADHADDELTTALPVLAPVALAEGEKLRVVATTNIVGDVVRRVAGDAIDLAQLLPPGADPHSYQARPDDLRALNQAHVIFVNGLHLEEAMAPVLENLDSGAPVIAVNTGVKTLEFDGEHAAEHADGAAAEAADHHHGDVDPHTWMDVRNVAHWVENITAVLSALDPAHAALFADNAATYTAELTALHQEIEAAMAAIPAAQRKVVTDHNNLGYLADAYGLSVVGAVIPSLSTMAAPSAQELATLQQQISQAGVKAILVGTTVNPTVAQQIAADTGTVVTPIYTGSLSDANGPAATYIDMMRYDLAQIVTALTAE